MKLLPWAFVAFMLPLLSGPYLCLWGSKPDTLIAFMASSPIKSKTPLRLIPLFMLLSILRYYLGPPGSRSELLALTGFSVVLPAAALYLPITANYALVIFTSLTFWSVVLFSFLMQSGLTGESLLPPFLSLLVSFVYTLCWAAAFFILLPPGRTKP